MRSATSAAHRVPNHAGPNPRATGAPFHFEGAVSYSQHCHHSKGPLAHTTHFSHRADSHRELAPVCFATMVLLDQWPCRMIAESGALAQGQTHPAAGGWKQPCLQPWLGMPTSRS